MNLIRKFSKDKRAIALMTAGMGIIGIVIGLVIAADLLPDAIVDVSCSTSYAGAPTAVITMMTTVLPLVVGAALVLLFIKVARK